MFELFPWNPMLETGISTIDTQHRRLVELLNRLARMYVGEADSGAADALLDGLTAYAQEHFATEEAIWGAALPADGLLLTQHQGEHTGFCTRMLAARAELQAAGGDMRLTRELLLFLSGWLAEHILQNDRHLALVVQGLQRGASLADALTDAGEILCRGNGMMMQTALGMYRRLSEQTLELLQERQQLEATTRAMEALKIERERQALAVSLAGMLLLSDDQTMLQDLQTLVQRVGETLGADRCVLRLYSNDGRQVDCRAEWCAPGVASSRALLGTLSAGAALDAWARQLCEQGEVRIDDVSRLPDWASVLKPLLDVAGGARAGAVAAVALRHRGAFLGWMAVHMVGHPRQWREDEAQWLQLLGSLLGSSLLRQRAEQQSRTLLDAIPAGVAAASVGNRRLLFCNDSFCALVGRSREELIGLDVAELHPPGELARIEQEFIQLAGDDHAERMGTIEVCRPDGSCFLAEVRQVSLLLSNERVSLAVFTDVTRRNAAEAALKASEQSLERQVRSRTLELAEANRQLQRSGQRMQALLELDRRRQLGRESELLESGLQLALQLTESTHGDLYLLSDDQLQVDWCALAPASRTPTVSGRFPLGQSGIPADALRLQQAVLQNDASFHAEADLAPTGNAVIQRQLYVPVLEGEQVRMLLGVANKTEPYDAQDAEQLQLLANDLWGLLLRHRAAAALAANRDDAVQSSRAKSTFLASMSHEIRTPLNAVIGFAQVLSRDHTLGARQREQVQIIAHSGEHLLQLLNDVLDLSKIEAGQLRLSPVPFNPALLLDEVARLHAPRAAENGLGFNVECSDSLPTEVIGDAGKLRQILLNLLGNALKFTSKGEITVRAAAQPESAGGWSLRVEVLDTGPGISLEDQARLFTPFQQGAAGERMGGGTGLGLSISRRLAALMGGTLELDSAAGQGSCFRLALPFGDGDAAQTSRSTSASPSTRDRSLESERISELDPDLRAGMRDAVRAGDMGRLRGLIDGLDIAHPALATSLRVLVQRYDYERLEALLQ